MILPTFKEKFLKFSFCRQLQTYSCGYRNTKRKWENDDTDYKNDLEYHQRLYIRTVSANV